MFARLTITIRVDENVTEQFNAVLDMDNISLEDFKYAVQDSFAAKFVSNIEALFKKLRDKIENEKEKTQLAKPETVKSEVVSPEGVKPPQTEKVIDEVKQADPVSAPESTV